MCLYANIRIHGRNFKALVTKEDIICYKHGRINLTIDPYRRSRNYKLTFSPGTRNGFKYKPYTLTKSSIGINKSGEVNRGLHSYKTKRTCVFEAGNNEQVVECVIPKGAKYYIGSQNLNGQGYASDKLIVKL